MQAERIRSRLGHKVLSTSGRLRSSWIRPPLRDTVHPTTVSASAKWCHELISPGVNAAPAGFPLM